MNRIVIVPYKMGSKSAKALKETLVEAGAKCFRTRADSGYIPKKNDTILYYGGTHSLQKRQHTSLNLFRDYAQNKLSALQLCTEAGLSCVPWTTDPTIALTWDVVVGRQTLTGHSGQGIFIHENNNMDRATLLPAPLYTKYIKKTHECRIHVFKGKVIDAQIKRKKTDTPETNARIRNIHTGWVYCREDFTPTEECKQLALKAVHTLALDFGAVDIIYNRHYDTYYLLEVNTAPGLEGTTLTNYAQEIINHVYS